ncbi:MAG: hypothetical protein IT168_18495 [Bryobacterales bacterium]|nr:hypothetical protein [Bryobacterales bacterium]
MADALTQTVARARRRAVGNLLFENVMVGAACGFAGAILLLLLGSAILEWYWVVVLFLVGAAVSAWRTWRKLPSEYTIAQLVDHRLELHDAISTAYHFDRHPERRQRESPEVVAEQRARALALIDQLDLAAAIPVRVPRQTYIALGVATAALSMFVVRYGVLGQLDLKVPMVEAVADFFRPAGEVQARTKQQQKAPRLPGEEPMTLRVDQMTEQKGQLDQAPDSALDTVDVPETNQGEARDSAKTKQQQVKAAADQQGDELAEGSEAERKGENGKEGPSDSSKGGSEQAKQANQQPDKQNSQGGSRGNSSMLDKMRDAMANLMAKLKIPQQQGQQSKQAASNQKGGQQGQREQGGGQKGEKGQGQPQGKGSPSDDQDAEQGQGEQQAQAGQGKSSDKGSDQGSPNESKSGMGKQDGSKDLKDAEQVAAMGKISEIFGKRAENMKGEVMIEVSSGKNQQLKTAYTQRGATHKEAGGEVHRDEIPLEFQHYVQQYFQQVRKGEGAKQAPSAPATEAPKASR